MVKEPSPTPAKSGRVQPTEQNLLDYDAAAYLADEAAPYFAVGRATMRPLWDTSVPTMGVDKYWRLYINPEFFESLKPRERARLLIHELAHLLREHARRREVLAAEPVQWNIAADMEVNSATFEDLPLPAGAVLAASLGQKPGKLAEDYYPTLQSKMITITVPGEGSGSDGVPRPWEDGKGEGKEDGAPPVEGAEADAIRTQVAEAIKQYQEQSRGTVPAGWDIWADSVLRPVVPWQRVLRHAVGVGLQSIGLGNRSYLRARERFGVCLPRHVRRTPVIGVVCDTSGSMGTGPNSPLQRVISEVLGIARALGQVDVAWCDAAAYVQYGVRTYADLKPRGGGGTDMGVGIKAFEEMRGRFRPNVIVTLTDGYTPWPAKVPDIPHVAVIVNNGSDKGPGWGTVIHVDIT